jgi:hypothetical protein
MDTTARKLSIYAFVAVAATVLTLGASTTFAASNTHTHHHIQLMSGGDDYFLTSTTLAASNTHTHHRIQLMSSGANSTSTYGGNGIGSGDRGSFSSTQYGSGSHSHHHRSSTDMIAEIK